MQAVLDLIDSLNILLEKIRVTVEPRIFVSVPLEELVKAIAICKKAIPKRPTHAVLANFLLRAKHGRITLTATNLDTYIEVELSGEIIEDGAVCIPAFLVEQVIGAIAKSQGKKTKKSVIYSINLRKEEEHFRITHKGCNQAIACMSADEFPDTPAVVGEIHNIPDFVQDFKNLKSRCSNDLFRLEPSVCGVNLGSGKMVATDGRTVAVKNIPSSVEAIIPATTPLQILDNPSFIVNEELSDFSFIGFFENSITITQRMFTGKNYATSWEFEIPKTVVATINKSELLDTLELLRLCALTDYAKKPDILPVWLELKSSKVTVGSYTELLENHHTLESANSSTDKLIYVSSQELSKLLASASDTVEIAIDHERGLIGIKQEDLLLGIMPLERMDKEKVSARGHGYCPALNIPYRLISDGLVVTESHSGFIVAERLPD